MNEKKIFSFLRTDDEKTLDEISAYSKGTESEMERIFRKSIEKASSPKASGEESVSDYELSVSGVEVCQKRKFRRFTAAASLIVAAGGLIAGGTLLYGNLSNIDEPAESYPTIITQTEKSAESEIAVQDSEVVYNPSEEITNSIVQTEKPTETVTEIEFVFDSSKYGFELHENPVVVESFSEYSAPSSDDIIFSAKNGPADTEFFTKKIIASDSKNISSAENKSYIYHMMLSAAEYYSSAKGRLKFGSPENPEISEFVTDIGKQYSYEEHFDSHGEKLSTICVSDNEMNWQIHQQKLDIHVSGYSNFVNGSNSEIRTYNRINDNMMVVKNADESFYIAPYLDFTNLNFASAAVNPVIYASEKMSEFDNWEIVGTKYFNGRPTAVIHGETNKATFSGKWNFIRDGEKISFEAEIDLKTGIMLSCREYDSQGRNYYFMDFENLEIDSDYEKRNYNPESDYTIIEQNQLTPEQLSVS